jgi:hypothetical protein
MGFFYRVPSTAHVCKNASWVQLCHSGADNTFILAQTATSQRFALKARGSCEALIIYAVAGAIAPLP